MYYVKVIPIEELGNDSLSKMINFYFHGKFSNVKGK